MRLDRPARRPPSRGLAWAALSDFLHRPLIDEFLGPYIHSCRRDLAALPLGHRPGAYELAWSPKSKKQGSGSPFHKVVYIFIFPARFPFAGSKNGGLYWRPGMVADVTSIGEGGPGWPRLANRKNDRRGLAAVTASSPRLPWSTPIKVSEILLAAVPAIYTAPRFPWFTPRLSERVQHDSVSTVSQVSSSSSLSHFQV